MPAPPLPSKKRRDPFHTVFRRKAPPLTISILLLAGVLFAGLRFIKPDEHPELTAWSIAYIAENDLLRLDAGEGLDTSIQGFFWEPLSLEYVTHYLQETQDQGLLTPEWLWYKAMTELEAGQLEAARNTVSSAGSPDTPFARCLTSLLAGSSVSKRDIHDLMSATESDDYTWWTSRLFRRLDLAALVPSWEARLKDRAWSVKLDRIQGWYFTLALVLISLLSLPVLWKLMRRGVRGTSLPAAPGLPPLIKAVAGVWVAAEALSLLMDVVAAPLVRDGLDSMNVDSQSLLSADFLSGCFLAFVLGTAFLSAWLTARLCYGRWRLAMHYAGARLRDFLQWRVFFAGAACILPIYLIEWVVGEGIEAASIPDSHLDILSRFWPESGWYNLVSSFASGCIIAPFAEELIYRGFLLETLKRHTGFWISAIISSSVFAAFHYYSVAGFIEILIFGLILSCVMHRTGKLAICIVAHSLYNLDWTISMFSQ